MTLCQRIMLGFALATLVAFGSPGSASAQFEISFGGGSDDDDNDRRGDDRRHRDRDDDHHNGIQFGGSDAKQIQQLIEGGQSNSGKHHEQGRHGNNRDAQNWVIEFGGATPFSARWYDDHPNAWRHHHGHHDHDDDAWKIATAAGVLGWLGWGGPIQGGPVVVYDTQPVVVDPNAPGEWMTLGAYSLMTGPGDSGTRLLELAVDKHGFIGGNYYDMITGASFNVTGRIDRKTQRATWSLEANQQLTFSAPLDQLTQGQGVVNVKFPSGRQQQWRLVRMENASRN